MRCVLKTIDLAKTIVDALEDKKGEDIVLMDIREVAPLADYFVICTGSSNRMIDSLAQAAVQAVKEDHGVRPRVEGMPEDGWVLADYGDVILHVFSPYRRDFYQLEDLWSEAKILLHVQ